MCFYPFINPFFFYLFPRHAEWASWGCPVSNRFWWMFIVVYSCYHRSLFVKIVSSCPLESCFWSDDFDLIYETSIGSNSCKTHFNCLMWCEELWLDHLIHILYSVVEYCGNCSMLWFLLMIGSLRHLGAHPAIYGLRENESSFGIIIFIALNKNEYNFV